MSPQQFPYDPHMARGPSEHGPKVLTIGEMAILFGVSLRTLRFYEDRGLLHPRREGSHRLYSAKDEIKLQLIITGKRLGFSLLEIEKIISSNEPTSKEETGDFLSMLDQSSIRDRLSQLKTKKTALEESIGELKALL